MGNKCPDLAATSLRPEAIYPGNRIHREFPQSESKSGLPGNDSKLASSA